MTMTRFNPNNNQKTPSSWSILALRSVCDNNIQWGVIGGLIIAAITTSATTPLTGALVAAYVLYSNFMKARGVQRNIAAIREYGCIAQVLKGDDFQDYVRQVGTEGVIAELEFAQKRELPFSADAMDFYEQTCTQNALPPALEPALSPIPNSQTQENALLDPPEQLQLDNTAIASSNPTANHTQPMDIALAMAYTPKSTIIAASPRVGKGFIVSKAISCLLNTFPDMEIWLIDPKNDPTERHYWTLIDTDKRVHFDLRPYDIDTYSAQRQFSDLLIRFNQSNSPRKLLIIDEFVTLNQKLESSFTKRLKDFLVGICSSGELTPDLGLGRFTWILTQSPYTTDLGFKTKASPSVFQRLLIINEASLQLLSLAIKAGFVPEIEQREIEYLLKNTGRVFYYSRTNSWYPVPIYQLNNPAEKPDFNFSEVVEKLQHIYELPSEVSKEQSLSEVAQTILDWLRKNRNDKRHVKYKGKDGRDSSFITFLSDNSIDAVTRDAAILQLKQADFIEVNDEGCLWLL